MKRLIAALAPIAVVLGICATAAVPAGASVHHAPRHFAAMTRAERQAFDQRRAAAKRLPVTHGTKLLTGAPYSCSTSAAKGVCPSSSQGYTSYAPFSDFSSWWNYDMPIVSADMWSPVSGETQTVRANSPGDWNATVDIPAGSNPTGEVTTYPDAGMDLNNPPLLDFGDITSSLADTVPSDPTSVGWQGYDLWFNNWGDEEMIQTNFENQGTCPYVAVQQFGGSNGVPVQTWGLCDFGGPGGEKVWHLVPDGTQVGGVAVLNENSGSVDVTAMTDWLINNGYMLKNTEAATTITALSAGFEITETAAGGSTWTYTNLSFVNNAGPPPPPSAPVVATDAASGLSSSAATLNGSVNPEGADASYQFDYGTTTSYGTSVPAPAGDAGAGNSAVDESAALTGLSPSTTYHYRIEATNSVGTTLGTDQSFTTPAAGGGGGTVNYGSTAPGASGATCATCSILTWNHTIGTATDPALVVGIGVGSSDDTGCSLTVTDNGVAMTHLATKHTDAQHAGFESVWGLAGPPQGTNTIEASVSGCTGGTPAELTGGSESFNGVSQSAPFGTPAVADGNSAKPAVTLATVSASDKVAAFAASGSAINGTVSGTNSRYIANEDDNSGAGNSAGASLAATGTNVMAGWNGSSDYWAAIAVEIQHD